MKQISTATLSERRKIEIDGHGYIVRRPGAGESLAMNQILRQMAEIEKKKEPTEQESDDYLRLGVEFIDAIARLYDDGGDGSKSKLLIGSLSHEEITKMSDQIWDEPKEDDGTKANS